MTKTPHKHAETIKAWADGAEIECKQDKDDAWRVVNNPVWYHGWFYRIKPTPKPDLVRFGNVPDVTFLTPHKHYTGAIWYTYGLSLTPFRTEADKVMFTFDGDTGKLKKVEVL